MNTLRIVFLVATAALNLCSQAATPTRTVPTGVWGGDHISMTVSAESVEFEFDCARAYISGPLAIDSNGNFKAKGTYRRDHPAPVSVDSDTPGEPATFSGSIEGDTMRLTIQVQGQEEMKFELAHGEDGRLTKCA